MAQTGTVALSRDLANQMNFQQLIPSAEMAGNVPSQSGE